MVLPTTAATSTAPDVTGAIRTAAARTGTSFDYLLKTAIRESNLDPSTRTSTSTARGLFQFIEGTWLATVKEEGGKYGYGEFADAITRTTAGRYEVADPALRARILALRQDPTASALMAGAFSARNARELTAALGRAPDEGELYMAHFLGPGGATRFLDLAARTPNARADAAFPEAARANRAIFYDRDGAARSLAQVRAALTSRHTGAATPLAQPEAPATAAPASAPTATAYAPAIDEPFSFRGLFTTARGTPVDGGVAALWAPTGRVAAGGRALGAIGAPLDLARFMRPGTATVR